MLEKEMLKKKSKAGAIILRAFESDPQKSDVGQVTLPHHRPHTYPTPTLLHGRDNSSATSSKTERPNSAWHTVVPKKQKQVDSVGVRGCYGVLENSLVLPWAAVPGEFGLPCPAVVAAGMVPILNTEWTHQACFWLSLARIIQRGSWKWIPQ